MLQIHATLREAAMAYALFLVTTGNSNDLSIIDMVVSALSNKSDIR